MLGVSGELIFYSRRLIEQKINEIARSVIVIDPPTIQENLAKSSNIGNLLGATIPGFGPPTFIDLIRNQTLRGRDPQYLLDGIPLVYNGGAAFAESPLVKFEPDMIGWVEVLYGPTSIYGAGAAGGVIQFFTRDPSDKPYEAEFRQQLTTYTGAPAPLGDHALSWKTRGSISGTLQLNTFILGVGDRDRAFDEGVDLYNITGYTVVDIGLSYDIGPGNFSLQLRNLFDNQYLAPSSQSYRGNPLFDRRVAGAPGRAISMAYITTF